MDVLDQRLAQEVGVVGVAQHDRDRREARHLRRPEPALARDQLVAGLTGLPHDDRLEDADLRIEAASALISSSSKRVRGCFGLGATALTGTSSSPELALARLGRARDQRGQASTETTSFRHHSPPLRNSRHRRLACPSSSSRVAPMSATACAVRPRARPPDRAHGRLGGRRRGLGVLVDDHHPSFGKMPGWGGGARWRDAGLARARSSASSHTSSSSRVAATVSPIGSRARALLELARFGRLGTAARARLPARRRGRGRRVAALVRLRGLDRVVDRAR